MVRGGLKTEVGCSQVWKEDVSVGGQVESRLEARRGERDEPGQLVQSLGCQA